MCQCCLVKGRESERVNTIDKASRMKRRWIDISSSLMFSCILSVDELGEERAMTVHNYPGCCPILCRDFFMPSSDGNTVKYVIISGPSLSHT